MSKRYNATVTNGDELAHNMLRRMLEIKDELKALDKNESQILQISQVLKRSNQELDTINHRYKNKYG